MLRNKNNLEWLIPVYMSETGFLLNTPLIIAEERLYKPKPSKKQHPSKPWVQIWIFRIRIVLNTLAIYFFFSEVHHAATLGWSDIARALFTSKNTHLGWYCIYASAFLHFLGYVHIHHHLSQYYTPVFCTKLYTLSQFSIVNFVLDLPGWFVPETESTRILIQIINICILPIFIFIFVNIERYIDCVGCFPSDWSIMDWDYAFCEACYSGNNVGLPPVCDQEGVICGYGPARNARLFNRELYIFEILLCISGVLYASSIPLKNEHYIFNPSYTRNMND